MRLGSLLVASSNLERRTSKKNDMHLTAFGSSIRMDGKTRHWAVVDCCGTGQLAKGNGTCLNSRSLLHFEGYLSPTSLAMSSDHNSASDTEYDRDWEIGSLHDDDVADGSTAPVDKP